ncbi:HAD family hydrolase [Viridibacillus arvi]|uniref:HAD family hydrolase n=1 Tax=Viridibacillus arvi TaxID=263475 RepID=UPI003D29E988
MKAILFDLDETILNRDASLLAFLDDQYERFHSVWGHIEKGQLTQRIVELDAKGYVWKDEVYTRLIEEYKLDTSVEELLNDYTERFRYFVIGFPKYKEVLIELKRQGYLLGIITNGKVGFQRSNISVLGIEYLFDVIVISEEVGMKKPDKNIFEYALAKLQMSPNNAVFIGDNPKNDVEAAIDVGMIGIWKRNQLIESYKSEHIIDKLEEVFDLLKQLEKN